MFRFRISAVNQQHFGSVIVCRPYTARNMVYAAGIWFWYFGGLRPVESEVWNEIERRVICALSCSSFFFTRLKLLIGDESDDYSM